jgi:predicted lactoylglutathione lyase
MAVSDVEAAKTFYLAALAPLGYHEVMAFPGVYGLGVGEVPDFWVHNGLDREGNKLKDPVKGVHIAFRAEERALVDQCHEAALKAGGTDNGKPGIRSYHKDYYAAYVLDADQNNIEVVCMKPE